MRIGVIGVGRMGSVHSRNLARILPAGALLIHDSNQEAARKVAGEVGGSVRPTAAALLDDADEAEMRAFLAMAAGDEPSRCTPDDAVRAQEIAVAAATATATGARTPVASRAGAPAH